MRVLLKRPAFIGGVLYEPGSSSGPGIELPDTAVLPTDAIILNDKGDAVERTDADMRDAVKAHNDEMAEIERPARLSAAPDRPAATNFPAHPLSQPASLTGSARAAGLETAEEEAARLNKQGVGLGDQAQGPGFKTSEKRDGENPDPGARRPGDPVIPGKPVEPKPNTFPDKKAK